MAISAVRLDSGVTAGGATSFATASVSPAASKLELLGVVSGKGTSTPAAPTVTGNTLTWVQVTTVARAGNQGEFYLMSLFRAMGSPSAGVVTMDFGAVSQDVCFWSLIEASGTDTSGTNGSGAIVQSVTNNSAVATSLTITSSTFADANNRGFAFFWHNHNEATTPRTNWTELSDDSGSPAWAIGGFESQWSDVAAAEETASATWANNVPTAGLAVEVKMAAAVVVSTVPAANPHLIYLRSNR